MNEIPSVTSRNFCLNNSVLSSWPGPSSKNSFPPNDTSCIFKLREAEKETFTTQKEQQKMGEAIALDRTKHEPRGNFSKVEKRGHCLTVPKKIQFPQLPFRFLEIPGPRTPATAQTGLTSLGNVFITKITQQKISFSYFFTEAEITSPLKIFKNISTHIFCFSIPFLI